MHYQKLLNKEAKMFDRQIQGRTKHGYVPDLRNLRKVKWFYNNVWREPEFVRIHLMPRVQFVLDIAAKSGGKVLELGCGCGYLCLELARGGLDVTGVDISPTNIQIANRYKSKNKFKRRFGTLNYICSDFVSSDIDADCYDTIVFFNSLHHVSNLKRTLNKVHAMLKSGGNLIACEPVRGNFTRKSAEFAAILRMVLPTWQPFKEKLEKNWSDKIWEKYVNEVFQEYAYELKYTQSPLDNSTNSDKRIIAAVEKLFSVKKVVYDSAFIDKLIGGLRGPDRYSLARFLKFLDNYMVKKGMLHPTYVQIHAVKDRKNKTQKRYEKYETHCINTSKKEFYSLSK